MAENSKIEWCDHTANFWWGCTKVSDGCKNCYADTLSRRYGKAIWGPDADRELKTGIWRDVHKWEAEAKAAGVRRRVFCASMSDFFEGPETCQNADAYAAIDAARRRVLTEIIPATPNLDWLLLTKRPQNVLSMVPPEWMEYDRTRHERNWPANVWVGTSVENQKTADERIPHLLEIPAAVTFLSCEPLLGPVNLAEWMFCECDDCDGKGGGKNPNMYDDGAWDCEQCGGTGRKPDPQLDWVIAGGESGPGARPMHPDWTRKLRDDCQEAGVKFLFKQWGEYLPIGQKMGDGILEVSLESAGIACFGGKTPMLKQDGVTYYKVGKKRAGRLLDGKEYSEIPGGIGA